MPKSGLLNPAADIVKIEKAEAATNRTNNNHGAQPRFVKRPKATIKLRMPSKPS
jgi:hypothetical protein